MDSEVGFILENHIAFMALIFEILEVQFILFWYVVHRVRMLLMMLLLLMRQTRMQMIMVIVLGQMLMGLRRI